MTRHNVHDETGFGGPVGHEALGWQAADMSLTDEMSSGSNSPLKPDMNKRGIARLLSSRRQVIIGGAD